MVSTSLVTRSAAALEMDIPSQLIIRPSKVDAEKLGVWCKELIKEGTKFGPFVGEKAYEVDDSMDPAYIWEEMSSSEESDPLLKIVLEEFPFMAARRQIVDVETKEFLFYINATNPHSGNWMRNIKCARFFEEQNIVSEQEGIDIFYQAIKDISPGEELLTWFEKSPLRRKKGKRRAYPNIKRAKTGKPKLATSRHGAGSSKADAYADVNYVSQRGRKRSVKKYWQLEAVNDSSDANHDDDKLEDSEEEMLQELSDEDWEAKEVKQVAKPVDKPTEVALPVESSTGYFQFELQVTQTSKNRLGRKVFQCDICSGIYRHSFSLKRHYIRNHINYKYISKVDRLNCSIVGETSLPEGLKQEEAEDKGEGSDVENAEENAECEEQDLEDASLSDPESGIAKTEPASEIDGVSQVVGTSSDTLTKMDSGIKDKRTTEVNSALLAVTEKTSASSSPRTKECKDTKAPMSSDRDEKEKGSQASSPGTGDKMEDDGKEEPGDSKPKVKYPMPSLYRCNICEQLYDTVDQLKEHFLNHPNFPSDKKFACEHCKMKFKHKQNLMRHEVVHTGAKPYTCNHCNKRFPTLTNQRRHERIHKGQKFTCSQCPGTFTQTGDLKKHMCKQHPETYNECAYCSKYFSNETVLASHLSKAHSKDIEANHLKICARKKARKVSLEKDRAESRRLASDQAESHSKSDPSLQFACTICRKRFRDYSNMCRHRRLAHEREASNLESQWGNSDEGAFNDGDEYFSDSDSLPDREKMDGLQTYFSHVSHNISNNLQHFIEGKEDQLTKASCHIRWKQKTAHDKIAVAENVAEIRLEEFNFPHGFQIRQLSELYESPAVLDPPTPPESESSVKSVLDTNSTPNECLKQTAVKLNTDVSPKARAEASSEGNPVDQGLMIRVPEIKTCTLCHSVFHNITAFNSHMAEKHQRKETNDNGKITNSQTTSLLDDLLDDCAPVNYSTKSCDATDVRLSIENLDNAEQPLDLSASSTSPSIYTEVAPPLEQPKKVEFEPIVEAPLKPAVNKPNRKFLCLVCFSEFLNSVELSEHQSNEHPSVDCRHAEVDMNFSPSFCKQPNPVGALNVSSSQLPTLPADGQSADVLPYLCTKCKQQYPSNETLHQHIAECGDYWRHLNTRVTWVFVLRGSELPVEKVIKKRGKFHWTKSPEESSRKQLQRMLLQQHLGDAPTDGTKGRFGRSVGRMKSVESVDDDSDLRRNRWRHGHQSSAYNPRRHVRRREMTELVDVQKCRGCDEEFKTILQLERHIPICAGKNRIKDLHAEKTENGENSDDENDYDPSKQMCIYCERQFTYLRMLKKHVTENCSVRKEFVEKGEYIDEEWEQEIMNKVQNSSRDAGQTFSETVAPEDGDGALDNKRGKRRKRGNNWGCRAKTKKSFKSSKSSDDGDSLFGWEDAFLSNWVKTKDGNQIRSNGSSLHKKCDSPAVPVFQKPDESLVIRGSCPVDCKSPALQKLLTGEITVSLAEADGEKAEDRCDNDDVEEAAEVISEQESPKPSDDVLCPQDPSIEQEIAKTEVEQVSVPDPTSEQMTTGEDMSATDVKQKLISKIQSKQSATKSNDLQNDEEPSQLKPSEGSNDSQEDLKDGPETVQDTSSKNEDVKNEEESHIDKDEELEEDKEQEEEVPIVKTRKRRGPRLTMKSKKRKNVSEKPTVKASQSKKKPAD